MIPLDDFNRLVERIKAEEGFSPVSYRDDAEGGSDDPDRYSWGYGTKAPGPGATISPVAAELALRVDLNEAVKEYHRVFKDCPQPINQVRREAFIDFIYNIGIVRFSHFHKMLREMFDRDPDDWNQVADEAKNSLWYRQVKTRALRIVAELRTGQYAT